MRLEAPDLRAIEAYFRANYRGLEQVSVESPPPGVPGTLFFIAGDLRRSDQLVKGLGAQAQPLTPESTAMQFLLGEVALLDLTHPEEEMRLRSKVKDEDGNVHFFFDKYLAGLRIENVDVRVHVKPDGSVFAFNGHLVSMPSSVKASVVQAARAPHIPEETVRAAVADDLGFGVSFVMRAEKLAVPSEPYVVWKADVTLSNAAGRWVYTLDAFSGRLISRRDNLRTVKRQQGESRLRSP